MACTVMSSFIGNKDCSIFLKLGLCFSDDFMADGVYFVQVGMRDDGHSGKMVILNRSILRADVYMHLTCWQ